MRTWTNRDQDRMLICRDFVLDAMEWRPTRQNWTAHLHLAIAVAANQWAEANGVSRRITVGDVERIEQQALGHFDYATKLALYVAEYIVQHKEGP